MNPHRPVSFVIAILVGLAGALGASTAFAQEAPAAPPPAPPVGEAASGSHDASSQVGLVAAPMVTVPLGTMASLTGPGIGGVVGVDDHLSAAWTLTGRIGYVAGTTTSTSIGDVTLSTSISYVPVLVGAKYVFAGNDWIHVYGAAETGLIVVTSSASATVDGASGSGSGTSTYLGGGAAVGMEIDSLDLRAGVLAADVTHTDSSTAATFSLGFRFASL
jgi:hypothetical protein